MPPETVDVQVVRREPVREPAAFLLHFTRRLEEHLSAGDVRGKTAEHGLYCSALPLSGQNLDEISGFKDRVLLVAAFGGGLEPARSFSSALHSRSSE